MKQNRNSGWWPRLSHLFFFNGINIFQNHITVVWEWSCGVYMFWWNHEDTQFWGSKCTALGDRFRCTQQTILMCRSNENQNETHCVVFQKLRVWYKLEQAGVKLDESDQFIMSLQNANLCYTVSRNQALKDFSTVFSSCCEEAHCWSFALTTNRSTTLPFAVAAAKLCVPVNANGVSSVYL